MKTAFLEHINMIVADPARSAEWLGRVFGWRIRWRGETQDGGYTVHVGDEAHYLALYRPSASPKPFAPDSRIGALNHVGVAVDDLEAAERAVRKEGFEPHSHADYEPGRRFYFRDSDGVEFEVACYD